MASKWSCLNPCLGGDIREDYNLENREQVRMDANKLTPVCVLSKFTLEQDFIEIPSFLEGNEERVDRGSGHLPAEVPSQRDMAWWVGVGVGGFLSSSRANTHQERKSSRFLSSIHSAPSSRPCPGNAGINSHLWRPKKLLHSGIRPPPRSSLWALKSFTAWILNYCGGSVANPFPWSHFPLTQICSRHYSEFRGSSRGEAESPLGLRFTVATSLLLENTLLCALLHQKVCMI